MGTDNYIENWPKMADGHSKGSQINIFRGVNVLKNDRQWQMPVQKSDRKGQVLQ